MGFRDKASTAPATTAGAKQTPAKAAADPAEAARAEARRKYSALKPPSGGGTPFLADGKHRVRILLIEKVQTSDGKFKKDPWFKIEVAVLRSTCEPVGVTRTVRRKVTTKSESFVHEELLALMMATQGFDATQQAEFEEANEDWPLMFDAVVGTESATDIHGKNPLADSIVVVEAFSQEKEDERTKAAYTVHNYRWSPDDEASEEESAA